MTSPIDYQGIVWVQGRIISEALMYVCLPLYFQSGVEFWVLDPLPSLARL